LYYAEKEIVRIKRNDSVVFFLFYSYKLLNSTTIKRNKSGWPCWWIIKQNIQMIVIVSILVELKLLHMAIEFNINTAKITMLIKCAKENAFIKN